MSIRHALLAFLSEGPKYGLQLRQEFEESTGEVWPLNVGQVYTTLQRLERDELIESDGRGEEAGPQKVFRITKAGRKELETWLSTPSDLTEPPRDELVIKVLAALRVPGVSVHDVIQVHRRYLVELMQQWTRLKEDEADYDLIRSRRGRRALPAGFSRPLAPRSRLPRRSPARSSGGGWSPADELPRAAPCVEALRDRRHPGARALQRRARRRAWVACRGDGTVGVGQVDVAHDCRQPRRADQRRGRDRR